MKKLLKKKIVLIPLAILAGLVFMTVGGEAVKVLWNWLTPALFGWKQITFWQALGLLALCRILFGGFGGHQHRPRSRVRRRVAERLEQMSPEERERFRRAMDARWGCDTPGGEGQ
jgi:hypothetical protein